MRILVVGGGGREHVLAWKIAQSPLVDELFVAPGNPGTERVATNVDLADSDLDGLVAFTREKAVDLVVVGPEAPLAAGLADRLAEAGVKAFGPGRAGAQLESSKVFAKRIMAAAGVPTSAYEAFDDPSAAHAYIDRVGAPVVIKADGLAAGKGVTVARDLAEAHAAVDATMVEGRFGDAGRRIILEECLEGEEASILAVTDGKTVVPLDPSQDHKPVGDGDTGPNTGGMGAYSPAPLVDAPLFDDIRRRILEPCITQLDQEGIPYRGVLYAGLMITALGPKVIEFNCRFGDPEAQVVLPRLQSDLVPLMLACCHGRLEEEPALEWGSGACVTVVMASGGYPGSYTKGRPISGVEDAEREGALVFHAGTRREGDQLVTDGGRVLSVTGMGDTISDAIGKAYAGVARISFEGAHYRRDIGSKALRRLGMF